MTSDFPLTDDVRQAFGIGTAPLFPLPGDASARRYARVTHPTHGKCLILADIPGTPHFENFVLVAEHLRSLGLSAPRVFAVDRESGHALVEDLGLATYTNLLAEGGDETALYDLATDTIAALHNEETAATIPVPTYDMDRLLGEVALLPDWFAPAMNITLTVKQRDEHQRLWKDALAEVASSRETLVIRDFHVDNLILLDDREGVEACGILDFQDAVLGSPAYDLVSLIQDARRDLSPGLENRCLERYLAARGITEGAGFLRHYHLLGAQRHAKVAGIYHRLNLRDGKPTYLKHMPRVLRRLRQAVADADLSEISEFLDTHIPPWRS